MDQERDFFENLNHVLDFQINDLRATVKTVKAPFLVASGCMNTIEFLGGIRDGRLGKPGEAKKRFEDGLSLLGSNIGITRFGDEEMTNFDMMWALRNGLTHQYLPEIKPIAMIMIGAGDENEGRMQRSVPLGAVGSVLFVNVNNLLDAIEAGRAALINELTQDEVKRAKALEALSRLPLLM
jgi:hypothetical protein